MTYTEHSELFKAVLAIAGVDGTFTRAEVGLLKGLAERVGVGQASLEAMMKSAQEQPGVKAGLFSRTSRDPVKALELLVAAARIDGEISEDERQLLLHIAETLKIEPEPCAGAFRRGLEIADRLRADRKKE